MLKTILLISIGFLIQVLSVRKFEGTGETKARCGEMRDDLQVGVKSYQTNLEKNLENGNHYFCSGEKVGMRSLTNGTGLTC
jgi:hypothetical protein